jgi:hypothetical protein
MSYFVFGLLDVLRAGCEETACSCAANEGLTLKLHDDRRQALLDEMLGAYSPLVNAPFLLTKNASDDTSDTLVSPYCRCRCECGSIRFDRSLARFGAELT